jgi:subtilisin family serine protease
MRPSAPHHRPPTPPCHATVSTPLLRDTNGHGTHVAAIAAGNYGAESPGTPRGAVLSGMAPRARIAVYKVSGGGRPSLP